MPIFNLLIRKKEEEMEDKKAQIRLISGISIIMFGTLAALFLGLGIALSNQTLSWIGGILMAGIPFVLSIIARWVQ